MVTDRDVCIAARNDDYEVVEQFLKEGGDPNLMSVAIYGPASLLHSVIQYDMPGPFRSLKRITYNTDGVAILTEEATPPVPSPIAKLLVDYGASLQSKDSHGMTVEYFIRNSGYSDHYKILF